MTASTIMKSEKEKYAERFADYMIDAMARTRLRQSEIARLTGLSRTTISQIVGKKPNSTTGKLILPERATVDRIAKAFGDPPTKARRAAGYTDGDMAETVEQALDAAAYWEQKGLGEAEKEQLRPFMEVMDREAERLLSQSARRQPSKVSTSKIQTPARKRDAIDEAIDAALAFGGGPVSEKDRQTIREVLEKRQNEKGKDKE
jgi:transcriptional regulator with XRE-family HTH domain